MTNKKTKLPLSKTHPKLAKEAHGWDPSYNYSNSAKVMQWKCQKRHVWKQSIRNRTNRGQTNYVSKCPVCNSVAVKFPKIAKQAYGWNPKEVSAKSSQKLKWKCRKEHIYLAMVYNRSNGSDCPICSGHSVLKGFNDLKTTHPHLAKEADGWDTTKRSSGSNEKVKWKCREGHKWRAVIASRAHGNNCPVCGSAKVLKGLNDLVTTHPKVAREAHGWDPSKYRAGSGKSAKWKCSKGHLFSAIINNRTRGGNCPICSNQKVATGFNDIETTHPHLAKEADGWDPTKVLATTSKKLDWICASGHKWTAIGFSRARGNNCPICSNQKILNGYNDLKTTHPNIAKYAVGWDPRKIGAGSTKKVKWTCKNKHKWIAPVYVRVRNKNCAFCSGDLLWKGFNDLKTTHPELAKEAHKWDTSTVMAGSKKKVKWRCSKGHIWSTSVYVRTRKMRPAGCPTCAPSGFDANLEGWLYLIKHENKGLLQIGISNYPKERVALHRGRGWVLLGLTGPMKGSEARNLEKRTLITIRKKGARILPKTVEKFDGYTESWSRSTLPVTSIAELIRLSQEFEKK
jgi:hypothetical protein